MPTLPAAPHPPLPTLPQPDNATGPTPIHSTTSATTSSQQPLGAGEPSKNNSDKSELTDIKKQLEETNKKLAAVQLQLQQLTDLLRGKAASSDTPGSVGLMEEMRRLREKLADVETELNRLRAQYSALSPSRSTVPTPTSPLTGKGLVRLVNDYPIEVTMVLNGTTYRLPPRQTMDVHVPAGEFSYQLLEAGGTVVRKPIREQEVVTLRIH
jgi:hypothetical protein